MLTLVHAKCMSGAHTSAVLATWVITLLNQTQNEAYSISIEIYVPASQQKSLCEFSVDHSELDQLR